MNAEIETLIDSSDEVLLDRLQRGACAYLTQYSNPDNGLVADTSRADLLAASPWSDSPYRVIRLQSKEDG